MEHEGTGVAQTFMKPHTCNTINTVQLSFFKWVYRWRSRIMVLRLPVTVLLALLWKNIQFSVLSSTKSSLSCDIHIGSNCVLALYIMLDRMRRVSNGFPSSVLVCCCPSFHKPTLFSFVLLGVGRWIYFMLKFLKI